MSTSYGFQRAAIHQADWQYKWTWVSSTAPIPDVIQVPIPRHMPQRNIWFGAFPQVVDTTAWAIQTTLRFTLAGSVVFSGPFHYGSDPDAFGDGRGGTLGWIAPDHVALWGGETFWRMVGGSAQPHMVIQFASTIPGSLLNQAIVAPFSFMLTADQAELLIEKVVGASASFPILTGMSVLSSTESI